MPLAEDARKRHSHETVRGPVIAFTVQLEVFIDGKWRPVIRYDSAHGISHVDLYRQSGETRKEILPLSFADALTLADDDVRERWEECRARYLAGEWP